jgi:hypothetical protein
MSEMADMTNEVHENEEFLLDDYFCGSMSDQDAYEIGIIDEHGAISQSDLERASRRNNNFTMPSIDQEIHSADIALNAAARANIKKDAPTCNYCDKQMQPRVGKYGKFYFCSCPEQVTVSDKYWQSLKGDV